MTGMETLAEAVERLSAAGFRDSFQAESGGLRALRAARLFAPEALVVEEVVRFEGASDPGDAAIVFALRNPSGDVRGTWVTAYGAQVDPLNAECLHRLRRGEQPARGGRAS